MRRSDTPLSPSSKRPRMFSHAFLPPREPRTTTTTTTSDAATSPPQQPSLTPTLPSTPPGLPPPPIVTPRQSTPRTPITVPQPFQDEEEERIIEVAVIKNEREQQPERAVPMEQGIVEHEPSTTSKHDDINRLSLFEFPIIAIECKYHFRTFKLEANISTIRAHRKFLELKTKQLEKLTEKLLKEFNDEKRKIVVEYITNSIETLVESVKTANRTRLDNLLLDQMRENAIRTIKDKATKENIERIEQAQQKFDRTLQLKFQLDKLDRRFNENMPPPALNIMDKLQFRSKELTNEIRDQYSEQWNSIIRKTKLELTSIMRTAKTAEITKSEKEHQEIFEKIPVDLKQPYRDLIHTAEIRQNRKSEKKLNVLEQRAKRTIVK